jgi:hypothetical protein
MQTTHVLEVLFRRRRHRPIHVTLPPPRRLPRVLFSRMASHRVRDGAVLLVLALLVGALLLTGAWMARGVGHAVATAERCNGNCDALVQPVTPRR